MKFHGIAESTFYLHLKECEFRFNYRNENIYLLLLKIFRNRPLF
jgi:transposase-like protein